MATTMDKVWEIAKNEVKLCCGFIRRDVSMGMLPIPIFTAASLLYRNAPAEEFLLAIAKTLFLGLLYLYPFVVGNQICGVQEDQVNKPDRPIAAGKTSLKAARIRWITLTIMFFVYACYLRVGIWSAMWIVISIAHNFLSLGDFGPTKDMCVGLGSIAQLTAAWLVGGAPYEIGWSWIKIMALYTFFPISLQDLRDVPGDLAVGRRTTPILIGDIPCRIYISLGVLVSQFLLIRYRILEYRLDWTTVLFSSILASLALTVIFRLFAFRDVKSDRYSYRLYTIIYLFQPLSACIALR